MQLDVHPVVVCYSIYPVTDRCSTAIFIAKGKYEHIRRPMWAHTCA